LLESSDCPISNYSFEYGAFVYLANDETEESIANKGFSPGFTKVYLSAIESGAKYIQFDCDGQTYDEFESFNW